MAKKQHKERIQQPKESQTASTLMKLFFLISFIVLGVFVFNDMPINWILGIYAVDILVSLIYVVINKGRIATSNVVHTNVRRILAFLNYAHYYVLLCLCTMACGPIHNTNASDIIHRWHHHLLCGVQQHENGVKT